nr:polyprotein 1ab [Arteriviridae sp.]
MSSGLDRCVCTPNARVFWEHGQVFCIRCLSARTLLPSALQTPELGVLGLFYKPSSPLSWRAPVPYPILECTPSGACWLSAIYPIARMTSGNRNFEVRLGRVAALLYQDGHLSKRHLVNLEVYERGCKWYPITGPVPGIALYANSCHVSDQPFVGATHVLTNIPLPQTPCRSGYCPFESAKAETWRVHGCTVFISDEGYMWTRGCDEYAAEPWGDTRKLCLKIIKSLPADHLTKCDLTEVRDEFSFDSGLRTGYLKISECDGTHYGLCWAKVFDLEKDWTTACRETDLAARLGYQLPYGISGPYFQRRLQVNGLKAVVKSSHNAYDVYAFSTADSFLRHIVPSGCPVDPFFVKVGGFTVMSNSDFTEWPKFNFGRTKYYGYSPPGDGACGLHCLSAVLSDMNGEQLQTQLQDCSRQPNEWLTDQDMYDIIMTLSLPVTLGECPMASYKVKCVNAHWTVEKPRRKPFTGLHPSCVRGTCGGQCVPVVTTPVMADLSPVAHVTRTLIKYHLGVEAHCDNWTFEAATFSGDKLSRQLMSCSDQIQKRLKLKHSDWEVMRDLIVSASSSRLDMLARLQKSACPSPPPSVTSSRVSLVPYDDDDDDDDDVTDENDYSVCGQLLAGSESVEELAAECHQKCYRALGTTRSTASTPTRDIATSMFEELIKPSEESESKAETKRILQVAIQTLDDAATWSVGSSKTGSTKTSLTHLDVTTGLDNQNAGSTKTSQTHLDVTTGLDNQNAGSTKTSQTHLDVTTGLDNQNAGSTKTSQTHLDVTTGLDNQNAGSTKTSQTHLDVTIGLDNQNAGSTKTSQAHLDVAAEPDHQNVGVHQSVYRRPSGTSVSACCLARRTAQEPLLCLQSCAISLARSSAPLERKCFAVQAFAKTVDVALATPQCKGIHLMTMTEVAKVVSAPGFVMPRGVGFTPNFSAAIHESAEAPAETKLSEHEVPATEPPTQRDGGLECTAAPPSESAPPPNWKSKLRKARDHCFDWMSDRVFDVFSHLHSSVLVAFSSRQELHSGDYCYALFCLFCLLFCFHYPVFGFLPLVGVLTGSGWRIRMSVFSVWLSFAVFMFQVVVPEPGSACTSASPECADALRHYTTIGVQRPVHVIGVGALGTAFSIFAKLWGRSRYVWNILFRCLVVLDLGLLCVAIFLRGRCRRCFSRCVRIAPTEVPLKVFPASKVARVTLLDLCDRFAAPVVDPILMATGYRGCWSGHTSPMQVTDRPVSYSSVDDKKISDKTVVPVPMDVNQSIKCLKVLQAGGSIQDTTVPKVTKVTRIPYSAPFFPKVEVDPSVHIIVDHDTYVAAIRSGYSVRPLTIGVGDFAAINKVPLISGGVIYDYLWYGIYVLANFLLTAWLTVPTTCGVGTNDPWCKNPFSVPIVGSGVVCSGSLCVSDLGLSTPLLTNFPFKDWLLAIAVLSTVIVLSMRFVFLVDVLVIFSSLLLYVFPEVAVAGFLFPLVLVKLQLSPLTVIWSAFFIASVNPWAGLASVVILILGWALGALTGVCGIITPYDIHLHAKKNELAITSAPENSYLGAVRRSALTGRCLMFVPSKFGTVLEGSLRTKKAPSNVVTVFGSCAGSGAVLNIDGVITVVTASHLLRDGSARVSTIGYSETLKFDVKGDFASCRLKSWKDQLPKVTIKNAAGKAYWLTSRGVEPGCIGANFAFCYTNCGDSGSAVVDEEGNLFGIHTGSNKNGSGMVTTPDGRTLGMNNVKLSEMSKFYSGPLTPVGKVPGHIELDVTSAPSELVSALEATPQPEGALSSVQLLCVFFFIWRMIHYPGMTYIAIGFFVLNELLPEVLMRLLFSLAMSLVSLCTPFSLQSLLLRLLIATLNRSAMSFWFFLVGAGVSLCADWFLQVDVSVPTLFFIPRMMMLSAPAGALALILFVHVVALLLYLFKVRLPVDVLVGNGNFEAIFFLKYFTEGNLRDGVTRSLGVSEGLTSAIAATLTDEDLSFLTRVTDTRCFLSASNMRDGAKMYIEAAYAKALRHDLAATDRVKTMGGLMARLEAFISGKPIDVHPGDLVVVIGRLPIGEIVTIKQDDKEITIMVEETRNMAGTVFTVGTIVEPDVLERSCGGTDTTVKSKKRRRAEKRGIKFYGKELIETVEIGGDRYYKMWDKATGDISYHRTEEEGFLISENPKLKNIGLSPAGHFQKFIRKHGSKVASSVKSYPIGKKKQVNVEMETYDLDGVEYDIPVDEPIEWTVTIYEGSLEAERLTVEQALLHMGHNSALTEKEKEKLQRIISKLQGLVSEEALNLLAASGFDRCTRGGLTVNKDAVKIVRYHCRTFSYCDVNLKIMSFEEWELTKRRPKHALVAVLLDGVVVMRPHVPSLIDVLINGCDTEVMGVDHGPGNTGVDGTTWDFEQKPTGLELELTDQIVMAAAIRRGDAPALELPYKLHPVRGDPYRKNGVLYNTRFGNISYLTPEKTKDPLHAASCFHPKGVPVTDGETFLATTLPVGFELYVPTIPSTVLDYLDGRADTPKNVYWPMGCAKAADADLAKFNLSTQGFVLPEVLTIVRNYLISHVGKSPAIFKPSTYPAKNSMAGINGNRFPTLDVQQHPNLDELCIKARDEHWQTVTPVTLKKQYCSKPKTRTILGTNNFMALGFRAALSGVTQAFMKKGKNSPIFLGKNKFQPLDVEVCGTCLEADLASCDRSTPAIVRWFTTNLLFEMACEPEWMESYVLNCCHDVLSSMCGCVTKRGGLSSGDPVTSISNTVYSLVIYTQHMVMSAFRNGHPIGGKFLNGTLRLEDLLEIQPVMIYSDDVVFYNEKETFPNYCFFVEHLDLLLGFKTDRTKTVITQTPNFLGCRILANKYLVPQRDRVLAALAYHMKAKDLSDYYCSAAAILMDSCAAVEYDEEWFCDLVIGIAECARKDGFRFPGMAFFNHVWNKVSQLEKKRESCAYCGAAAFLVTACGLDICAYHAHGHSHCRTILPCGHSAGSNTCQDCSSPCFVLNTELDKVLKCAPHTPQKVEMMQVNNGLSSLPPGRYQARGKLLAVRRDVAGNVVDAPDGEYQVIKITQTCKGINMVAVQQNILRSVFMTGAPGTGKTTYLLSVVKDDDVVYTPTHRTMRDIVQSLGNCRFDVPKESLVEFPPPSRTGPMVRLIGAGYVPARTSYLDEAGYCNPIDVLKLLSHTPVHCVGDLNQLHPVGFDGPCFAFSMMPGNQLPEVYRYGSTITNAISKFYKQGLVSRGPDTNVIYQKVYQPVGQVITPYHRDREGPAITIDSSQGCTFDVCTLYLPTPDSLNVQRALVGITRSRYALFIYDPHKQLEKFIDLPSHVGGSVLTRAGDQVVTVVNGKIVPGIHLPASTTDPEFKKLSFEGTASPLPQVAHNLGYFYSPDLCQFAKIPEAVCEHWPVVTAKNVVEWPDRLVCSMTKLNKFSKPIYNAGYHVGPSIFLGIPGVLSYYLTNYRHGEAQPLPDSLFSTGRIATNVREFLDDNERRVANENSHAFVGEVTGTTIGGSHHITSKFLPRSIVPGSVVKVGVCAPGKAAKALCTVTDVYLPDLEPYLQINTQSRDWKVLVDFSPVRLMVWKDATAYFHEGISPLEPLSRYVPIKEGEGVYFDLPEFMTNVKVVTTPGRVSVSPDKFLTDVVLSQTPPEQAPKEYKLLFAQAYRLPGIDLVFGKGYIYQREGGDNLQHNLQVARKDLSIAHGLKKTGYMFPHG